MNSTNKLFLLVLLISNLAFILSGSYKAIKVKLSGLCLQYNDKADYALTQETCNKDVWNQRFYLKHIADDEYAIHPVDEKSKKYIDGKTFNIPNANNGNVWKLGVPTAIHLVKTKDEGFWYELKHYGKVCMDIEGSSTAPGAKALSWQCYNGDNQKFTFPDLK